MSGQSSEVIHCPNCKEDVPKTLYCLNCGYPLYKLEQQRMAEQPEEVEAVPEPKPMEQVDMSVEIEQSELIEPIVELESEPGLEEVAQEVYSEEEPEQEEEPVMELEPEPVLEEEPVIEPEPELEPMEETVMEPEPEIETRIEVEVEPEYIAEEPAMEPEPEIDTRIEVEVKPEYSEAEEAIKPMEEEPVEEMAHELEEMEEPVIEFTEAVEEPKEEPIIELEPEPMVEPVVETVTLTPEERESYTMDEVRIEFAPDPLTKEVMESLAKNITLKIRIVRLLRENQVKEETFKKLFDNYVEQGKLWVGRRDEIIRRLKADIERMEQELVTARKDFELLDIRKSIGDAGEEEYSVKAPAYKWDIENLESGIKITRSGIRYVINLKGLIPEDEVAELRVMSDSNYSELDGVEGVTSETIALMKATLAEALNSIES